MSNILKAFVNITNDYQVNIETLTHGNNRANNMGKGLETYIKNIFANTTNETNEQKKLEIFEKLYSYQGNKNNRQEKPTKISKIVLRNL